MGAAGRIAAMLATRRAKAFPMCSADAQRGTLQSAARSESFEAEKKIDLTLAQEDAPVLCFAAILCCRSRHDVIGVTDEARVENLGAKFIGCRGNPAIVARNRGPRDILIS